MSYFQLFSHYQAQENPIYCESILFRGAEISLFEDDRQIRGYLTSWIALPTKLKKYKIITFNFLTGAKLRPNTETGSIAKLRISE